MLSTLIILLLIILGYIIGKFSKDKTLLKFNDLFINILLYLLLFTFGVSFGLQKEMFSQFGQYGIEILILTLSGIIGSAVCAWIVWIIYRRYFAYEK